MMVGVAIILLSLAISALTAVAVDTAYRIVSEGRWPADVPPSAVALIILAGVAGAVAGSATG